MQQQYAITVPWNQYIRNASFDADNLITSTELIGGDLPINPRRFQVNCWLSVLSGPNKGLYYNTGTADIVIWIIIPTDPVQVAHIHVSSAEIKALNTSPLTLVPAPGVGKYIIVDKIFKKLNFIAPAYTQPGNTNAVMNGNSVANMGNFLNSGSSNVNQVSANNFITLTENAPLELFNTIGNPTTGNSTLDVIVYYQIATL